MSNISDAEARAWADQVKLVLGVLDTELEESTATQVLGRVANVYDTSSWISPTTTPSLIRKVIAMMYVGWYILRTYSEEEPNNDYGLMLIAQAERILDGIVDGSLSLPDAGAPMLTTGQPSFFPTDAEDGTANGIKFTMGQIW
jgi:hypothetical protein